MRSVLYCRRTFIAVLAICMLAVMAFVKGIDTSAALASVAIGLACANSAEAFSKKAYRGNGDGT